MIQKNMEQYEASRQYRDAFADIDEARLIVPEVFEEKYEDKHDRVVLREMVKAYKEDLAIPNRVKAVYGAKKQLESADVLVSDDAFADFATKAKEFRLLDRDEVPDLFRTMKTGVLAFKQLNKTDSWDKKAVLTGLSWEGAWAYQAVLSTNLRLVFGPARAHAPNYPHVEPIDVLQYGYLGLQRAIEKFDEAKGYAFSTYALIWITQSIQRGMDNDARIIRLPTHISGRVRKFNKIGKKLSQELGREPTREELLEATGLEAEDLDIKHRLGQTAMTSLNQVVGENNGHKIELGDLVSDDALEDDEDDMGMTSYIEEAEEVERIFSTQVLTIEEKYLLSFRYGVFVESLVGTSLRTKSGDLDYEAGIEQVLANPEAPSRVIGELLGMHRASVSGKEAAVLAKISIASTSDQQAA